MTKLVPADVPWTAAGRAYAVVLLFIPGAAAGEPARIVFIRRSVHVRSHKRQIAFPGGGSESEDKSPADTALRELEEELGLSPSAVTVIGMLPATKSLDGTEIRPIVGTASVGVDAFVPAPAEVEHVFAESWTYFTPAKGVEFGFNIFGNWRSSRVFSAPSAQVWGLTAEILNNAALGVKL